MWLIFKFSEIVESKEGILSILKIKMYLKIILYINFWL